MIDVPELTFTETVRHAAVGLGLAAILTIQFLILVELDSSVAEKHMDLVETTVLLLAFYSLWPTIRFVGLLSLNFVNQHFSGGESV